MIVAADYTIDFFFKKGFSIFCFVVPITLGDLVATDAEFAFFIATGKIPVVCQNDGMNIGEGFANRDDAVLGEVVGRAGEFIIGTIYRGFGWTVEVVYVGIGGATEPVLHQVYWTCFSSENAGTQAGGIKFVEIGS